MTVNQKRLVAVTISLIYIGLLIAVFFLAGKPFVTFLGDHGRFRDWVAEKGILGVVVFVGMTALQVFAAIIPGEPFEIAGGYTFGWFNGTLLTLLGIAIGQTIVFFLIRKFGNRGLELFIPREKAESVRFFKDTGCMFRVMFILFFIPGTPKDILTYCAALTKVDYISFITLTMLARIPSVVTSTVSGSALSTGEYVKAGIILTLTAILSIAGMILYTNLKTDVGRR